MLDNLETTAVLEKGDQKIPVTAKFASRYSFWIKIKQTCEFTDDDTVSLTFRLNGKSLRIHPCRLLSESNGNGHNKRLVFMQDVYDTHSLLAKNKVVTLQAPFDDLPHLLARKDRVKKPFKDFVADLGYDLHVYRQLFDDLDAKLANEPQETQALARQAVLETEGRKFRQFFHGTCQELDRIVSGYSKEEHQLHGAYFRNQLWTFILGCPLMARSNIKPRGYAGDSKMMQMIYLNDYQGNSTFSRLMHKYTVGAPASQSVRNRQTIILDSLHHLSNRLNRNKEEKIKILSVACGPAWELKKLLVSKSDFDNYHFTLLDQDRLALDEARQMVDEVEKKANAKANVDYVQASVRNVIANKVFAGELGTFDFIYSMGLFDYLSTPVAKRVLNRLYRLLSPQGELVVGNFHVSHSSRSFMEYWGDWYLIHRTDDELLSLLSDANAADVRILFEDSRNQMFLKASKPPERLRLNNKENLYQRSTGEKMSLYAQG